MVIKEDIYNVLREVYDPEIRVNIVDLGLIYEVQIKEDTAVVYMTLTSPNCPVVPQLKQDVINAVKSVKGIEHIDLQIVFDPPWDPAMMSEEAKLELGFDVPV